MPKPNLYRIVAFVPQKHVGEVMTAITMKWDGRVEAVDLSLEQPKQKVRPLVESLVKKYGLTKRSKIIDEAMHQGYSRRQAASSLNWIERQKKGLRRKGEKASG
jgi:hypothetical protein